MATLLSFKYVYSEKKVFFLILKTFTNSRTHVLCRALAMLGKSKLKWYIVFQKCDRQMERQRVMCYVNSRMQGTQFQWPLLFAD